MHGLSLEEVRAAERAPHSASAEALFELGLLHSGGAEEGEAALKGSAEARARRRLLAEEMTPQQIAEAHRLAAKWIAPH